MVKPVDSTWIKTGHLISPKEVSYDVVSSQLSNGENNNKYGDDLV